MEYDKDSVVGKQIVRKEIARSFTHGTVRMSVRKKLHTKIDNTIRIRMYEIPSEVLKVLLRRVNI